MKIKVQLIVVLICTIKTYGISQNSITVSGNNAVGIYGSTSYTIGEVFYTYKGLANTYSEGVQQSYKINSIENGSKLYVSIYPNPSKDFLYFLVEDLNFYNLSYQIISISGCVLQSGIIINQKSFVSLSEIPNGDYIVKINRGDKEMKVYKILKTN